MLMINAPTKISEGTTFRKPSDLPKAIAHTASNMPETIRMTHAMKEHTPECTVFAEPGTVRLVRILSGSDCLQPPLGRHPGTPMSSATVRPEAARATRSVPDDHGPNCVRKIGRAA